MGSSKEYMSELFKELTLLVADDEELAVREMKRILQKSFKEVYTAGNGIEAWEVFEKEPIDIIVSDINMPKKTGLEFAQMVKDKSRETPIIIVTAYSEIEYLYDAIEIGIDQFIHKPMNPRKLFAALGKCAHLISAQSSIKEQEAAKLKSTVYGAKKELLKDISHHWRNPLQILVGVVDTVEEVSTYEDAEFLEARPMLHDYCGKAKETLEKMSFSLKSFIQFIDSKNQKKDISLKNTFEVSWRFCSESFEMIDCELEIEMNEDISIFADEASVNFSIYQILKNAFEEFERKKIEFPKIKVHTTVEDDVRFVWICDNAGGISEQVEPKLFEPYVSDKGVESGRGGGAFSC